MHDLELSPDGTLYVLEHVRRVTKLNILTGEQKELSHLGLLGTDEQDTFVTGLTLGPSGEVFVTVYPYSTPQYMGVVRIDPNTGQQTLLTSGGFLNGPIGIALSAAGKLIVGNASQNTDSNAGLVEVDPIDGRQRLISSGLLGGSPWGVAVGSDGSIYVGKANPCCGAPATGQSIHKVDPVTGAHSIVLSGGSLFEPRGIAIDLDGRIISTQSNGTVVRIDPVTKAQVVVASGGFIANPLGIRVSRISVPSNPTQLTVTPSVTISWPLVQGNFTLQSSPFLGPGAIWSSVDAPLVVRGTNITATLEESPGSRFFRLAQ